MARLLRGAIAALVVTLVAVGCGNASDSTTSTTVASATSVPADGGAAQRDVHHTITDVPGVSDGAIDFAVVGTKTNNPLGICILDCYLDGVKAYFAYRNSEGGIYGRKLKVGSVTDDQLANNKKVDLGIVSDGKAFGTFQASLLPQGWGNLNDAGVPTYTWGIDAQSAANREAVFPSTVIQCADCTRRIQPFVAMKAGATKAAVLGYSASATSQQCADSVAQSFEKYAKETGVQQVYLKDNLPYGLPNGLGPEVTAMKKAGVDFIATCFDLNAMKTLAQALERAGMRDKVTLYHSDSYNQEAVSKVGGLFDGDFVEVQFRPFEADPSGSALGTFEKWMAEQKSSVNELAMVGWINASLAYDGLLAAGPDFDRAKVVAATNALKGWTADGLVPAADWAQSHRTFTQKTRTDFDSPECGTVVRVDKSGKFTLPDFENPKKPWLCWPGTDLSWSDPVATSFG